MGSIRAIALDVDGVLTDGGFWLGSGGCELKRFSFADVMGISLARKAGLHLALISGEDSPIVDAFAHKLGISFVEKNCKEKAAALRRFAEAVGVPLSEVCFMGDDVNDLQAMEIAGLTAAPANAQPEVTARATVVTRAGGGAGAVRELVDTILAKDLS